MENKKSNNRIRNITIIADFDQGKLHFWIKCSTKAVSFVRIKSWVSASWTTWILNE